MSIDSLATSLCRPVLDTELGSFALKLHKQSLTPDHVRDDVCSKHEITGPSALLLQRVSAQSLGRIPARGLSHPL
jgi:hypothetical protein